MENRFEEPDFRKAILQDSGIGLWCIEIDEGKPPRAFLDDTFRKVMGIEGVLSPEESYGFWYERVLEADREKIQTAIREMTAGRHAEVLYAWNHPETGIIYIRCGGTRDPAYKDGLRFCGSHQDVSQLARSRLSIERQLAQREKEYRRLTQASETSREILNALPGGVAVIRRAPDGIWAPEFLSDGFAAMCEMPLEQIWEMYRKDAMSGVHPDDQETLDLALNRYFNGDQECTELVYRLRRGQEGYFWVRNSLTMVQNEQGARKVYCVYRDITEELQEKERLRQQYSELLSRHYHAVGPGVLMAGHSNISQNRILEIVSDTDASLLQTTGEDREAFFIGLSGLVEGEKERQAFLNTFLNRPCLEAFARGQTGLEQSCFVHLPGKVHGQYIQFKVRMVTEPDSGDVTGILTAVDVAEQTVTRKILNRLSGLGCDLISDVDLVGDRQTFLTMGGEDRPPAPRVSFSEYNAHALSTYVVPEDRRKLAHMLDPAYMLHRLQQEESYSFSYSIEREPGRVQAKNLTVFSVDLKLGRVCIARRDVTESVQAERESKEALERALAAAEKASRAKSEFLSSMSHDIRTPMNAIMGMTTLAQAHLDDREQLSDCLRKIALSSEHLLSLINDILDMNKIEQSKLTLQRERIVLSGVLERMASMFAVQAREKRQRFSVRQSGACQQPFYGDLLRLNQILINLLGNAVKYTPEGGVVELEAEQRLLDDGCVGCRFTVRDTGVGMTPEFLQRLFDPFSRGAGMTHVEGSGLGLSITKGLVNLMGGRISVESRLHQGSTFTVELEFDAAEEEESASVQDVSGGELSESALAGCHLLAAEDNELNAEILRELLAIKGIRVDLRENGAEAVRAFADASPGTYDAILMDIQMPVMNGYEATKAIRALHRADAGTIPILAMTANAFDEDRRAAEESGMNGFLSKPIQFEKMMQLLRRFVRAK